MNRIHSLHDLHDEKILRAVISSGEGPTLEFKRDMPGPMAIAKIMSAFANTEGGVILFGVDDNGRVVGIKDTDQFNAAVQDAFVKTSPGISGYSSGIVALGDIPIGCILIWPQHGLPVAVGQKYFRKVGHRTLALNKNEIEQIIHDREEPGKLSRIMLNPPFRGGQDHLISPPRITIIPPLPLGSERGFHPCIFQGYENPLKEEADGKEAGEYERDCRNHLSMASREKC